jgi:putative flavoprotein involved in K+ transport
LPTAPFIITDTLIVGAGQAGLAAAYYLQQRGIEFIILEAAPAAGAAWDARYDSLRLFSPAWASGLPGLAWPGNPLRFPSRAETATYLRDYAAHFRFPVLPNQQVTRLAAAEAGGYVAETAGGGQFAAQRVIIATGPYTAPRIPNWAGQLPAHVAQLHSRDYRRPAQLAGTGPVAVVGSGNSALQIAVDVAETGRPVFVAFDENTPAVPNSHFTWTFLTLTGLMRVPQHTALGGIIRSRPEPVVSNDLVKLRRFANATFIGRAEAALATGAIQGRRAVSAPLDAVVWATGFRPDYPWLQLPLLNEDGTPRHRRGLTELPGVAFLGLSWLDSRNSALLNGAGADARRVVTALLQAPPVR